MILKFALGLGHLSKVLTNKEYVAAFPDLFDDDDEVGGVGPAQAAFVARSLGDVESVFDAGDLYGPAFISRRRITDVDRLARGRAVGIDLTGKSSINDAIPSQAGGSKKNLQVARKSSKTAGSIGPSKKRIRDRFGRNAPEGKWATPPQQGYVTVKPDELGKRTGTIRAKPSALDRQAYKAVTKGQMSSRRGKIDKGTNRPKLKKRDLKVRVSPGQKLVASIDNKMLDRALGKFPDAVSGKPPNSSLIGTLPARYAERVAPTTLQGGTLGRTVTSGPDISKSIGKSSLKAGAKGLGILGAGMDAYDAYQDFSEGNYAGAAGNTFDVFANLFLPTAALNLGISSLGLEADGIGELTADILTGETSLQEVGTAIVDKGTDIVDFVEETGRKVDDFLDEWLY